jgi:hypothetical protein
MNAMADSLRTRTAVALLVGIGEYRQSGRIPSLRYAKRDVKALARLLIHPDVAGFARERVVLLTDRRAKRDKIVHYLSKWLPAEARKADLVVIYFAGHGVVHRLGQREEGFLLPYDATLKTSSRGGWR